MDKTDIKKYLNKKYLLLNSIHNQLGLLSKKDKNITESSNENLNEINKDNIFIKYLQDPNILYNNKTDLINFINELKLFLNDNESIIFPFLDACPKLVKAYIQSDLDEEKLGCGIVYIGSGIGFHIL